jgi:hypothetical protein
MKNFTFILIVCLLGLSGYFFLKPVTFEVSGPRYSGTNTDLISQSLSSFPFVSVSGHSNLLQTDWVVSCPKMFSGIIANQLLSSN